MDPHKYSQPIFDKLRQYNGAKIVFSINGAGAGTTGYSCQKKKIMNLETHLTTFTKINSK